MAKLTPVIVPLMFLFALVCSRNVKDTVSSCGMLTIIHTNDVHARFEQTSEDSDTCSSTEEEDNECYAGFSRIYQKAEEIRQSEKNVIFLNAGDYYEGTLWYTYFKYRPFVEFVPWFNHTAMSLGNHEFDDGVEGLVPFVSNLTIPVLAANLDASAAPELQKHIQSSTVIDVDGCQIGIIGYITPDTASISSPGDSVSFSDEIEAITAEVEILKAQGVTIFIALGHSGFDKDKEIAAQVPDIDIVVGGHSHTFLYTGTPPDDDVPVDDYPTVIQQSSGRYVPVVQAYAFGKYLGYLQVEIGKNGEFTSWTGSPILLDPTSPQNELMEEELVPWEDEVDVLGNQTVGTTKVDLLANWQGESNLGNLITDSMVYMGAKIATTGRWTEVSIALVNSGSIRHSIYPTTNAGGTVTMNDLLLTMPYQNTIDVVKLKGKYLRQAMDFSAGCYEKLNGNLAYKCFLQVSGLEMLLAPNNTEGSRVLELRARCMNCTYPYYETVQDDVDYVIAMNSFLSAGGDGYSVFSNYSEVNTDFNPQDMDVDVWSDYITNERPIIYQGREGRIRIASSVSMGTTSNSVDGDSTTPSAAGPGGSGAAQPMFLMNTFALMSFFVTCVLFSV